MRFEWDIKDWREDIGEYYDQHFSEEEMEIIYEIIRGNVGMETLREKITEKLTGLKKMSQKVK